MLSSMSAIELADRIIDSGDGLGDRFEAGIGRGKDGADAHGPEIGEASPPVKGTQESMDFAYIILAVALVAAAVIVALAAAPRRPRRGRMRASTM